MLGKVRKYIQLQHMIDKGDRIVVGVSGGADSVVLLLVLQELKEEYDLELFVVHINHGIRKEASEDEMYVKRLCESLSVAFYLYTADIPAMANEKKMTEEEMGRLYRYRCFFEVMEQVNANKLAVAHHMDDQAETLLFHLIRGSRISGAAGMRPVMDVWGELEGKIIRPLLKCKKEELKDWLMRKKVSWQEDCTNQDDTYSRNRIRNQVIPVLGQINAQAVVHMAEFAEEMAEYQEFFQSTVLRYMQEKVYVVRTATEELKQLVNDEEKCNIVCETSRKHLMQQQPILARAVIYEMLCMVCGKKKDIGNVHVQAVYELLENQSGRKVSLPYEMEAVISYENIQIRKNLQKMNADEYFEIKFSPAEMIENSLWEKQMELPVGKRVIASVYSKTQCTEQEWKRIVDEAENAKNNYTKFFECDTIEDTLCIRIAAKNDYFVMNNAGSTKKLSRYFIDQKIPMQQRQKTLVVAIEHKVLWVIGERRCEEYKVTEGSRFVLKITYEGE